MIDSIRELIQRHPRFLISTPMRFRVIGEKTWHAGTTLNISKAGILFEVEAAAAPGTHVEIRFELPVDSLPDTPAMVSCRGLVVRCPERGILAARISAARINRR